MNKINNMEIKKEFKKEQKRFEFTVYLNDNIIVQRFFNIIGFNYKAINSLNFKDTMDYNSHIIKLHMKNKTLDFMNDNARLFKEIPNYEQNDSKDLMKIIVKLDGRVIGHSEWDATIYPAKVRYMVNIREHIYNMITNIQKCLSEKQENLDTSYLEYNLAV
jgi:hypothetical protein